MSVNTQTLLSTFENETSTTPFNMILNTSLTSVSDMYIHIEKREYYLTKSITCHENSLYSETHCVDYDIS